MRRRLQPYYVPGAAIHAPEAYPCPKPLSYHGPYPSPSPYLYPYPYPYPSPSP